MIKTLGNFALEALLGKGGMGEVYKAKDQKLGRDVAIKVLPEEFAKDADRVARFQREAKLLASLNHPNIAAIHGLEESGGTHFLVLELIEGDTLADRLKRGAIPVEESLKLALQIAEALEAAHEKGVIHRDLKPANIKVTPDGKVKVLDFGLAKAFAGEQENLNLSNSPTLSVAATQQGVILGTAAYMSPEQARGKEVDKRADIWAFGVVLFEMMTGRQIFAGETVSDTLASVLAREPQWKSLPSNLHPRIHLMLERCLKKEPKNRYHDIADARVDIQEVLADPSGAFAQSVTKAALPRKLRIAPTWVAAAVILTAIVAGTFVWNLRSPEPRQIMRFGYELPDDQQFNSLGPQVLLAVSRDGNSFVYSTDKGLCLRSVDKLDARLISGTNESSKHPFFSPDGQWIGYWTGDNRLMKIFIDGGTPVILCSTDNAGGADWQSDNTILYGDLKGIWRVSSDGGTPEQLVPASEDLILFPQLLPDGKTLMYSRYTGGGFNITVHSLETGERKELFAGVISRYLPSGHIVFMLDNDIYTIGFDSDNLETIGGNIPLEEGIFRQGSLTPQYAVSDSGTFIYIPDTLAEVFPNRDLVWVDKQGAEVPLGANPDIYFHPRISPDGEKVALMILNGETGSIKIWDCVRKIMTHLTSENVRYFHPLWTPDGKDIIFSFNKNNEIGLCKIASAGAGEIEEIASLPFTVLWPNSWSHDGKTLILTQSPPAIPLKLDVAMCLMENDLSLKPLLQASQNELQPRIAPDGRWMAYASNESGEYEVYVRPFPEVDSDRVQVSKGGGYSPLWSPDGKELFYRNNGAVMSVPVEMDPVFDPGNPKELFRGEYVSLFFNPIHNGFNPWEIHPDGKRFLMMKPLPSAGDEALEADPRKIIVVLNFDQELKQKAPMK